MYSVRKHQTRRSPSSPMQIFQFIKSTGTPPLKSKSAFTNCSDMVLASYCKRLRRGNTTSIKHRLPSVLSLVNQWLRGINQAKPGDPFLEALLQVTRSAELSVLLWRWVVTLRYWRFLALGMEQWIWMVRPETYSTPHIFLWHELALHPWNCGIQRVANGAKHTRKPASVF